MITVREVEDADVAGAGLGGFLIRPVDDTPSQWWLRTADPVLQPPQPHPQVRRLGTRQRRIILRRQCHPEL